MPRSLRHGNMVAGRLSPGYSTLPVMSLMISYFHRRHIRTEIADISAVNAAKAVSYHLKAGIGSGYYIAVLKNQRLHYL